MPVIEQDAKSHQNILSAPPSPEKFMFYQKGLSCKVTESPRLCMFRRHRWVHGGGRICSVWALGKVPWRCSHSARASVISVVKWMKTSKKEPKTEEFKKWLCSFIQNFAMDSALMQSPRHTPALTRTPGGVRKRALLQECQLLPPRALALLTLGFSIWPQSRTQQRGLVCHGNSDARC